MVAYESRIDAVSTALRIMGRQFCNIIATMNLQ